MLVALDVELAGLDVAEGQQIERGQIAGGVVQEHVFRARIGRADRAGGRAGVPVVHRGVELQAGIGAGPGGVTDFFPQLLRLHGLGDLAAAGAPEQVPVGVGMHRFHELVGDAHRIVRVLPGDGEIGFRVPIGIVDREIDVGVALLGELDHALDEIVGHVVAARQLDLALERGILLRAEAVVAASLAVHAGLEHGLEVLLVDLGAGDQRRHLLLFLHLPVDILLDVRVIDVDHHHLGGAPRGAARLDGAGRAVADLEEGH